MSTGSGPFVFRDGGRLIRFGAGVVGEAAALVEQAGFRDWVLLTTQRARPDVPEGLLGAAAEVLHVPAGPVPDAAAAVRDRAGGRDLVAFGGGRVVDAAKAVGAADGGSVAAVPTTLAGSTFTPFHRMPTGFEGYGSSRPALAVCDPELMASAPLPGLAATAMNALAHAIESLYAPGANPVTEGAALRGIAAIGQGLAHDVPEPEPLALGALLGGYAVGVAGLAVHHAVCQTTVRMAGTPHAQTNAVVLPYSVAFMAARAPEQIGAVAAALGGGDAADAVARLSARAGVRSLSEIGLEADAIDEIAAAAAGHPGVAGTPGEVGEDELRGLLSAAL